MIKRISVASILLLLALVVTSISVVWIQGRRTPEGWPQYVALGSSFAAGAGLGRLQSNSPLLCARSMNGYPQQLARNRALSIVDMSCGGAVTKNVLSGGQFFQGPQLRTITVETRLVTITVGGNDVGYIGDLSLLAARDSNTLFGRLVRAVWKGPRQSSERGYSALQSELLQTLLTIHERAPEAKLVVATYPTIVPPDGTCELLGINEGDASLMREVGNQLAAVTRSAAQQGGAILVDMHVLGALHNACSSSPWTAGWKNASLAPFHPTLLGAKATADAVSRAIE